MRQKCSRKLFILTISLLFSVSYSVTKIIIIKKINKKTTETGHKQRARRRPLRRATLSISTFSCVYVYEVAQVAEIFIGFSNTRASPFDLARGIFLISIDGKYVLF